MTEVVTQTGEASGTPEPTPASAPTPSVPEGYVPQADLVKEQERARGFQSEAGKLKAELDALRTAAPAPVAPTPTASDGPVDAAALVSRAVSEAVAQVNRAGELRDASVTLKTEFPTVAEFDPSIFTPDRLAQFETADALRGYVEDVNTRLTKLLQPGQEQTEAQKREALAAQAAGAAGPTGTPPAPNGMPTLEQLAGLSPVEMLEFKTANPGVVEKVLAGAMSA